jgi:hypothetical protein
MLLPPAQLVVAPPAIVEIVTGSGSGRTLKVAAADGVTVILTAEDVEAAKFCVATKDAVMECGPTARPALMTALPAESAAVPICVEPSKNATEPAGTPPADVTWAVSVAVFPELTVDAEDESDVEVAAGTIVRPDDGETEPE